MRILSFLRYPIFLLVLLCTACGTALPTVKPFKLDVQQGNVVTSKMLLQLRPGMTKSQVRFIMGTPLVQDSFHGNRWDYVYQMREGGKLTEQRRVILDFESDLLKSVRGDVTPSVSDKAATDAGAVNTGPRTINPSPKPQEKGVLDKLKFWKKDETVPAKEAKPEEAPKPGSEAIEAPAAATESKEMAAPVELMSPSQEPPQEVKSILVVPMEGLPMPAPATESPVVPAESAAPVPASKVEPVKAEPIKMEPIKMEPIKEVPNKEAPAKAVPTVPKAEKVIEAPKAVVPEKAPEITNSKSEVITPIDSKTAADKAELPPEDSPTFFDKMLEKIGF
ncbi:MAG: outer membrane protein assembly factor BamE [Methylotenera sp.]